MLLYLVLNHFVVNHSSQYTPTKADKFKQSFCWKWFTNKSKMISYPPTHRVQVIERPLVVTLTFFSLVQRLWQTIQFIGKPQQSKWEVGSLAIAYHWPLTFSVQVYLVVISLYIKPVSFVPSLIFLFILFEGVG